MILTTPQLCEPWDDCLGCQGHYMECLTLTIEVYCRTYDTNLRQSEFPQWHSTLPIQGSLESCAANVKDINIYPLQHLDEVCARIRIACRSIIAVPFLSKIYRLQTKEAQVRVTSYLYIEPPHLHSYLYRYRERYRHLIPPTVYEDQKVSAWGHQNYPYNAACGLQADQVVPFSLQHKSEQIHLPTYLYLCLYLFFHLSVYLSMHN